MTRPFGRNYAFVVAGVTFAALLVAAGMRAAPGVLMLPLGVISAGAAQPFRPLPRSASACTDWSAHSQRH